MDCKQINELMVEYLYLELDTAEMEHVQAHLRSCARCTEELAAYEKTRSLMQDLQEKDPSPLITDLLLQEAIKAATPQSIGIWDRLRESMRIMVLHPAMTAAVTLVLVLGVSFYVYREASPPTMTPALETLEVEIDQPMGESATITRPKTQQEEQHAGEQDPLEKVKKRLVQQFAEPDQDETGMDTAARDTATKPSAAKTSSAKAAASEKKLNFAQDNTLGQGSVGRSGETLDSLASSDVRKQLSGDLSRTRSTARRDNRPSPPAATPLMQKNSAGDLSSNTPTRGDGSFVDRSLLKGDKSMLHNKAPMQTRSTQFKKELADSFQEGSISQGKGGLYQGKLKVRRSETQAVALEREAAPGAQAQPPSRAKPRPTVQKPSLKPKVSAENADDRLYAKMPAGRIKKRSDPQPETPPMSRKGPSKKDRAYGYELLAQADKASAQNRCGEAFNYFNQALAMDPDLLGVIFKKIQSCVTRLADKNEEGLALAQKTYPRLAGMMAPTLEKVRRARSARQESDEIQKKTKKAAKAKKAKKAPAKANP